MTATAMDPSVETALFERLEADTCAMCDLFATARLVVSPCGHKCGLCTQHRAGVQRTFTFRSRVGTVQPCGYCGTPVASIRWEPFT